MARGIVAKPIVEDSMGDKGGKKDKAKAKKQKAKKTNDKSQKRRDKQQKASG